MVARVLICGVSTRAAAESAARAGFEVTAIDAYGDLDQHPAVRALSMARDFGEPFTAAAAARAAKGFVPGAVVYLSPFENHPGAVDRLTRGGTLWGNPPTVLRRVRDPQALAGALRARGFDTPAVHMESPNTSEGSAWLIKALRSGGGRLIRDWRTGDEIPRGSYVQRRVVGTPGSVLFVTEGRRSVVLGVSRQLIGEPAFGADGYRYCGNILAPAGDPQFDDGDMLAAHASALAQAAAEEFDLRGVNGIDFVARRGVAYPIELNPRWTASMELVERARGLSVFAAHAGACREGILLDLGSAPLLRCATGKAIVFARDHVRVGDTRRWLGDDRVRDVPHPGERIRKGEPVCTVFASTPDAASCYVALCERAERVYADLATWRRERSCEGPESR